MAKKLLRRRAVWLFRPTAGGAHTIKTLKNELTGNQQQLGRQQRAQSQKEEDEALLEKLEAGSVPMVGEAERIKK